MIKSAIRWVGMLSMGLLLYTVYTGANAHQLAMQDPGVRIFHYKVALLTVLIGMLTAVLAMMLPSAWERQVRDLTEELEALRAAGADPEATATAGPAPAEASDGSPGDGATTA